MKNKGLFITFEGGEGTGKSTQIRLLAEFLKKNGQQVVVTREPGGLEISEEIREVLLKDRGQNPVTPLTETLLFLAARAEFYKLIIKPYLEAGKTVLCDRSYDSTLAYQGYGRGVDLDLINTLNKHVTAGIKPNLTVLLDIPPKLGIDRVKNRGELNRLDAESLEFHEKVNMGYLEIARKEPNRFVVINADCGINDIAKAIREELIKRIGLIG